MSQPRALPAGPMRPARIDPRALLCLESGSRGPGVDVAKASRALDRTGGQRLLCARCGLPVTTSDARIEIAGRHEHTCANPHGFAFRVGCFARAPGCAAVGPAERYWSWFPGHEWQIALCRGCHIHLGWLFTAGRSGFHALILDRLVPEGARDPR